MKMKNLIASIIMDPKYASEVAKNMVFGFMEDVGNDKKKQEVFFGFVNTIAVNAVAGIRNYYTDAETGAVGVKLKARSPLKPFEGIINNVLPGMLDNIIKSKAKNIEESVTQGW